jgi:hypothetical protein
MRYEDNLGSVWPACLVFITIPIYSINLSLEREGSGAASLGATTVSDETKQSNGQRTPLPSVENRVSALGYIELFQGSDEGLLDGIWNEPGAPDALARLSIDSQAPALARFLAAEIMFYKQAGYPPEEHKKQLASVYATALAQNFTGSANTWGMPGVLEGLAGDHFIGLGEAAVGQLVKLLDDDRRAYYAGSEEATLGNTYRYRVKDLAAFYISKIRNVPLKLDQDPGKRDEEIKKLELILK